MKRKKKSLAVVESWIDLYDLQSSLQPPRRRGRSSVRDLPSASGDCLITHLARFGHVGFGQEPHVLRQPLFPLFCNHHHLLKQASLGTLRYQHCYRNIQLCKKATNPQ